MCINLVTWCTVRKTSNCEERHEAEIYCHIKMSVYSTECSFCAYCNYMEQSPSWESNRTSASQEIPCIMCNQKVHCHIHKQPAPCPYPEPGQYSPYLHHTWRYILTHWGRGHLNCLNARSRGINNLNQLLYCVSLKIYNKFVNYFCELKFSGNTHQRP